MVGWGCGLSGALGNGNTRNESTPTDIMQDVVAMSCGESWSACLTASGDLYTWGKGQDGRLGHGDTSDHFLPQRVDLSAFLGSGADADKVASISAGHCHAAVLTEAGRVLVWGRGYAGQLGLGTKTTEMAPQELGLPEGVKAKAVACGGAHTVVLAQDGRVLAFGRNTEGQLGDGGQESRASPVEVTLPGGRAGVRVACGKDFSVIVTEDGKLFAMGCDDYGQLGRGRHERLSTVPTAVAGLAGQRVVGVAAGDYHVLAVTEEGMLFAWGYGRAGQLGIGSTVDLSIPTAVKGLPAGVEVVGADCGRDHSLALLRDGRAFAWGRAREGQLGRGDVLESGAAYRALPLGVEALGKQAVAAVAAGKDHSLVLLRPR